MNETLQIIFGLFGGLAIFLYGMNLMSDSLQKVAGERMRTILGMLTKNPVLGVLSGALVTAVLQSSSATTVMAIGFVSAGLMSLPQAISIIFGANIGTTMTAQLIAFNLSDYIYLIIIVGFLLYFFAKKEKIKDLGATIFGFGLLFDGIEIMGSVMKPLATSPVFAEMIQKVADVPVLGLLVGLCMTLLVQSSSATIAVLQNVASTAGPDGGSLIGLVGALPVLFGDNIGTTITALIASVGLSLNAKRTALAHSIFNISGSLIFIWFIVPYAHIIELISPKGPEIEVISRQIANAHTGFNVVMTLIWTPLLFLMVKIVCKLLPDKEGATVTRAISEPRFLDRRVLNQPVAAIELASNETIRVTDLVRGMLYRMSNSGEKEMKDVCEQMISATDEVKSLNSQIQSYLSAILSAGKVDERQAERTSSMIFIIDNLDRISDYLHDISENVYKVQSGEKNNYSKIAMGDIRLFMQNLIDMYETAIIGLVGDVEVDRKRLEILRADIFDLRSGMFKEHMKRVRKGKCDADLTAPYGELLQNLESIGSACMDLADQADEHHAVSLDLGVGDKALAPA
ncbi:MAG: Na/Pi cotransporter family protein [Peptococcaceae bacterium]|nr:Na/Pi cotransporter family protein [Peptococcaceae bacterium]